MARVVAMPTQHSMRGKAGERKSRGREGVRLVKPPRVTSERYLSTWKDVSTLPAHPKEGEHAANWESAPAISHRQWRKGVIRRRHPNEQLRWAGNDSQRP